MKVLFGFPQLSLSLSLGIDSMFLYAWTELNGDIPHSDNIQIERRTIPRERREILL